VVLQGRVASASGGLAVPDVTPLYSPTELFALLEGYGEAGRRAFLVFTLYDLFYPFVAYGFALLLLASLVRPFVGTHPRWIRAVLLPPVGLAVELLEQVGFLVALLSFPRSSRALGWTLSVLTSAKLVLLAALLLVASSLAVARAAARVRGPGRPG
jgi:hypothetical protein